MKRMLLLAAVAGAWPAAVALAQAPPAKPDLAKAQIDRQRRSARRATAPTATARRPVNPNLAGQPAEYITLQLRISRRESASIRSCRGWRRR